MPNYRAVIQIIKSGEQKVLSVVMATSYCFECAPWCIEVNDDAIFFAVNLERNSFLEAYEEAKRLAVVLRAKPITVEYLKKVNSL